MCKKTYDRPFIATKLKFTPNFDHVFLVGGQDAVHVWKLDERTKKASNFIIPLGKIKRTISDMVVSTIFRRKKNPKSDFKAMIDYLLLTTKLETTISSFFIFVFETLSDLLY